VYSRNIIKPTTQRNNLVTVPSRLHLPLIPHTIQRRVVEVNSTCGDDVTVVSIIRTPWPIVLGQVILSIIIAARGSMVWSPGKLSRLKQALWAIGLVRAVGALVYQVMDIAESNEIIPSVGTSVTLGTLLVRSFEFNAGIGAQILSYLSISIASLGLLLYTINGTLAWVLRNDANVSLILVSEDQEYYYWTMSDWMARFSWIAGAFFPPFMVLCPIFISFCCGGRSCRRSWKDDEDTRAKYFRRTRMATNFIIVVGGMAACISAVLNAAGGLLGSSTTLCGDYLTLPGSASGFWDVWTQDKLAVVRSLFTW
jgi:hypothetical protein